jgi:hypothetical protein
MGSVQGCGAVQIASRSEMLRYVAQHTRIRRACEVGGFRCEFSREIMSVLRGNARLDLVDTFGPLRRQAVEWANSIGDRVSVYAMTSLEWARIAAGAEISYEFVYIDADRSYQAVAADLQAYWPLVAAGGWLCWHDYTITPERCVDPSHYDGIGVRQAVGEFCAAEGMGIHAVALDGYLSFAIRKAAR